MKWTVLALVGAAVAIVTVTLLMTGREPSDWRSAGLMLLAVAVAMGARWLFWGRSRSAKSEDRWP